MQFAVFTVPAVGGEAMGELNRFLAGHRVIGVEKQLVTAGGARLAWVFYSILCVEYLGGPGAETCGDAETIADTHI